MRRERVCSSAPRDTLNLPFGHISGLNYLTAVVDGLSGTHVLRIHATSTEHNYDSWWEDGTRGQTSYLTSQTLVPMNHWQTLPIADTLSLWCIRPDPSVSGIMETELMARS